MTSIATTVCSKCQYIQITHCKLYRFNDKQQKSTIQMNKQCQWDNNNRREFCKKKKKKSIVIDRLALYAVIGCSAHAEHFHLDKSTIVVASELDSIR